jgi:hypothetical protein
MQARTICNNCMQLKDNDECFCNTKKIGVKYIGLFSDCIYIDNNNIRCKKKCISKDDYNLFVCEKHASKIPLRLKLYMDTLKSKK